MKEEKMRNEDNKVVLSKDEFKNSLRHYRNVEDFKKHFNEVTYNDSQDNEASLKKRLKTAENVYIFNVAIQKDIAGKDDEITKDYQNILDYIQTELKKEERLEADSEDIEWLLQNATQYQISKETGIAQSKLSNLKSGKIKIENLTFKVASDLTDFSKKIQKNVKKC